MRTFVLCSITFVVVLAFGVVYFGRARAQQLRPVGLPTEKGWGDVTLPITRIDCASLSDCTLIAMGLHNGRHAGIQIRIHDVDPNKSFQADPSKGGIKASQTKGGIKASQNGVVFTSLGDPTLQLMKLLSSLYEHPTEQFALPKQVGTTAITLQGDTSDLKQNAAKIKIFHDDNNPDGPFYFELFVNVDLPNKTIELAEKDPDYRMGVLRSFGAKVK